MADLHPKHFRVKPGKAVRLKRWRTNATPGIGDKAEGARQLAADVEELAELQERLYVEDRHAVLVIIQARDGAGKDSTIKHVLSGVNPQGVSVSSFKVPSLRELDHDYLWRSVAALPERGTIGVHNRSHYEEVLVARVHKDVLERAHLPAEAKRGDIWRRRYRQINRFEEYLVENGTLVVKLFLHVSRDEQRKRFLDRIKEPAKHWKFSLNDVKERPLWGAYDEAYEQMLEHTSTPAAPWFIVPADHKWYLHAAVAHILVRTLRGLDLKWPKPDAARRRELDEGRRLLEQEGTLSRSRKP